LTKGTCRL